MACSDISFMDAFREKGFVDSSRMSMTDRSPTINICSTPKSTHTPTTIPEDMGSSPSMFLPLPHVEQKSNRLIGFLDLPIEVRLQIYSHLLVLHRVTHAHLSPSTSYPPATSSAYFLHALSTTLALNLSDVEPVDKYDPVPFPTQHTLTHAGRGTGCGIIPSALLATSKQIYLESRVLPWHQNEFIFINWFCSGVYSARAFLRCLKPWQRNAMRWARIEVLGRDLKDSWVATMVDGYASGGEWKDLCELWAGNLVGATESGSEGGLRGLRLGIKGRLGSGFTDVTADGSGNVTTAEPGGSIASYNTSKLAERGVLDVDAQWVSSGLSQMKALQWLELEIEDDMIDRDVKVKFCLTLGERLSLARQRVDVVFVEKVVEGVERENVPKPKSNEIDDLAWVTGANYVWGTDI